MPTKSKKAKMLTRLEALEEAEQFVTGALQEDGQDCITSIDLAIASLNDARMAVVQRMKMRKEPVNDDLRGKFVMALADFLTNKQGHKSILLQCGNELAKEWANVRNFTPLMGYPKRHEAEAQLRIFLKIPEQLV